MGLDQTVITNRTTTVDSYNEKRFIKSTDCYCLHGSGTEKVCNVDLLIYAVYCILKDQTVKFLYFPGSQQLQLHLLYTVRA